MDGKSKQHVCMNGKSKVYVLMVKVKCIYEW